MCGDTAVHLPHFTSPEGHLELCTPPPFRTVHVHGLTQHRGPFESAAPTERRVSSRPPQPWQYQGSIRFRGSVLVPGLEPFAFLFAVGCLLLPSFGGYEEGLREHGGAGFMGATRGSGCRGREHGGAGVPSAHTATSSGSRPARTVCTGGLSRTLQAPWPVCPSGRHGAACGDMKLIVTFI